MISLLRKKLRIIAKLRRMSASEMASPLLASAIVLASAAFVSGQDPSKPLQTPPNQPPAAGLTPQTTQPPTPPVIGIDEQGHFRPPSPGELFRMESEASLVQRVRREKAAI